MTLQQIVVTRIDLGGGWTFNSLTPRLATITDPLQRRRTSYLGFETEAQARAFQTALQVKNACTATLVRQSQRLSTHFECKVWGCSTELIVALLSRSATEESVVIGH